MLRLPMLGMPPFPLFFPFEDSLFAVGLVATVTYVTVVSPPPFVPLSTVVDSVWGVCRGL